MRSTATAPLPALSSTTPACCGQRGRPGPGPDYINFDETKTIAPLSDQSASDEPVYRKGEVLFMTEEMIETVVDAFGRAAEQAKTCGFEMAMIHAGHGWLIHQFLSR